jgi:hypothetical protein
MASRTRPLQFASAATRMAYLLSSIVPCPTTPTAMAAA